MNHVVIDTDPGLDDAHAIMLAHAHAATRIEALTVVAGNVSGEQALANALKILDLLEADIPVYPGCQDGLVVPTPRRAISHGRDGLGDIGLPISARSACSEHAALALIRLAKARPGELTLIALGPLTNVALAVRLEPALPGYYRQLVVMGGSIYSEGNAWTPSAEFNFYVDPEAAHVVLQSWPGLRLVPWETVVAHPLTPAQRSELIGITTRRGDFYRRTSTRQGLQPDSRVEMMWEADPLAAAVALEPDIVVKSESRFVQVDLGGTLTRGQSVVDWSGILETAPNVEIVMQIDRERFFALMKNSLL